MQFLTYILSPLFQLYYNLIFLFFHPILVIGFKLGGHKTRSKVVGSLNYFLSTALGVAGARMSVKGKENIPNDERPLIVASNHQSQYDIPILGYLFAKKNIDYVAKTSLGKGLPTVSFNLRNGYSALVDRNNGAQSVREIFKLGRQIESAKSAACIFPEGTRSRTGELREFMPAGLGTLTRSAPSALVVPFVIKGHSDLVSKSSFWLRVFQKIEYTILPAIDPKGMKPDELTALVQSKIQEELDR